MYILGLFMNFLSNILSFKIFGIELITHIIAISIAIIIFQIIKIIGNSEVKKKHD